MNIDYIKLKKDLINYYGTASNTFLFMAMEMITKIENASNEELLEIAKNSYFNLNDYKNYTKKL